MIEVNRMSQSIRRTAASAGTFLNGCAWFFILVSLAQLAWVIGTKMPDASGATALYATYADGVTRPAAGLSYDGAAGLAGAFAQVAIVLAAALASLVRPVGIRRIGHTVLVAWAGWWALSLTSLAAADPGLEPAARAGLMTLLFGATIVRALRGWWRRPVVHAADPEPPLIASPESRSAGYDATRTDVAPAERLMLRLRDVTSRSIQEVRGARLAGLRDRAAEAVRHAAPAAKSRLGGTVAAARRATAGAMKHVASFADRQASRLDPDSMSRARDAASDANA